MRGGAPDKKDVVVYCGVGGTWQKDDLVVQVTAIGACCVAAAIPVDQCIQEVGGRMNVKRKLLCAPPRQDEWLTDHFLHRQVRKRFRRRRSHTANQFIAQSDKHSLRVIGDELLSALQIAKKYSSCIKPVTTSGGKNVGRSGSKLRIIVTDGFVWKWVESCPHIFRRN